MHKYLIPIAVSSVLFSGSAFAGELGVTNSYGHSFREGTGITNIQFNTTSQLTENSDYGAVKKEASSYGNVETTTTPGNSGNTPGGQNSSNTTTSPGGFSDTASSFSFGFGERNYTESTSITGTTQDTYSFGSTNFTHSVGVFSR